ncbi:MAG: dicarboxylate/amino acid:cation symporter [Gemmatimonadota bacterium]|nr:MAG: dicarboxylate/amino acid:cation symporter [Gemmatimonadota bacterium]
MSVKLQIAIALGLVAGLLLGLAAAITQAPPLVGLAEAVEPIGTAFVDLLKMVVIPLVAAVIFVGVASLGDLRRLGRMGAAAMGFFAVTSVVGVLLGMGVMRALLPLASEAAAQAIAPGTVEAPALPGPIDFLLSLIPSNPFAAAAEGALLPLIVFVVMFAAATGVLPAKERDTLIGLAKATAAALIKLTHWILWIAPVGVFALAAPVTARAGWAMLQSLIAFVVAVLVALLAFIALVYAPAVRFLGRRLVGKFLKGCMSSQVIAAATVSSPATVPAMLEAADDELRVSRTVSGFVIPLGAGVGRAGSAVFQGAGLAFLAWLYGVSLPVSGIGGAVVATVIVSFTVPSIPGGSVLSLAPALGTVGIPLDGLAVLLGVDRIPDMARTATNVTGTLSATVLVNRLEERAPTQRG